MVEKVIEILKQSGIVNTLDIRVTYTHEGVKVNISYFSGSEKQKKPYPTLKQALQAALNSYIYYISCSIKYCENDLKAATTIGNAAYHKDRLEHLEKLLPFAVEALGSIC
jgi:hypothetical protein